MPPEPTMPLRNPIVAVVLMTGAAWLAGWSAALSGAEQAAAPTTTPPSIRNLTETDQRMPANHIGGWKLDVASPIDPALPRILLVGDSILSGYRGHVIKALAGKACVDTWITPVNQGNPKVPGMFKEVIATAPYAVIHFNLGLHGVQPGRIPEGRYIPLTTALVEQIRASAPTATLIWASTTPWMLKDEAKVDEIYNPVVVQHNAMAAEVMQRFGIPVNDLYALMVQHLDLRANALHWQGAGTRLQGQAVVASLEAALQARNAPPAKP